MREAPADRGSLRLPVASAFFTAFSTVVGADNAYVGHAKSHEQGGSPDATRDEAGSVPVGDETYEAEHDHDDADAERDDANAQRDADDRDCRKREKNHRL